MVPSCKEGADGDEVEPPASLEVELSDLEAGQESELEEPDETG